MNRLEMLGRAYELAFFIHGDEEVATRIVCGAAAKLEVAATAQSKRLYYHPARRHLAGASAPTRTSRKIWLSDAHLLQRLIYIESETYEKRKEQQSTPPDEDDLVICFVKHLVRITLRRNSFYVAVGISRLLYNYSTAETMEIYSLVLQDPERVKDDYYYRSRKGVLMNELKERFGDLLRTCRAEHGEQRFQTADRSPGRSELVKECLSLFTPWGTPCLVPDGFDPVVGEIVRFVTRDPKHEDGIELNRIHALAHPRCYERLISALRFRSPDEKLALPQFFLSASGGNEGPHSRQRYTPELDEKKLRAIEDELAEQALRRKKSTAGLLRVMVDGVERAHLDLGHDRRAQFTMARDGELIEVRSSDSQGDIIFATRLLGPDDMREAPQLQEHSIRLEGGQEISIDVSQASLDDADNLAVAVTYRERTPATAASLLQQFLAPLRRPRAWRWAPVLISALTLALVVLAMVTLKLYRHKGSFVGTPSARDAQSGKPAGGDNRVINAEDGRAVTSPDSQNQRDQARKAKVKQSGQSMTPKVARKPSNANEGSVTAARGASDSERTRDFPAESSSLSLMEVKKVFVEPLGDSSGQAVIEILSARLRSTKRFLITRTRDEADAVLKVAVQPDQSGKIASPSQQLLVTAVLVNAHGDVLWPGTHRRNGASYSGSPAKVATSIVSDLLGDLQNQERKR
ncbi:MAG TPA: hypothetical protein VN956_24870 [Pyrinomonadaceae bacterium]|nr:hypothetical protein [Pyrinomonadaceae bacterium]